KRGPAARARFAAGVPLDARRLVGVREARRAACGLPGAGQRGQGEPFLLGAGALAAEAELEVRRPLRAGEPEEQPVAPLRQRRLEAVGVRARAARPVALVDLLAVEPDHFQAR